MASYTAVRVKHATLVATTVDTVTLSGVSDEVEVLNRSSTDDLYFTTSGIAPTVAGDDCYIVPKGQSLTVDLTTAPGSGAVVKLISAGTPPYSVTSTL